MDDADIIFLDDGSSDETYEIIRQHKNIKYIKHDAGPGYGALIISGIQYARDYGYEVIISVDPKCKNMLDDILAMMDNIRYGFDMVSCSRILENYDHRRVPPEAITVTEELSQKIREITGFDVTDPLSGIKAVRLSSIMDMELTDFTHGVLLQLLIQAAYYNLDVIEIPSSSGADLGTELFMYDRSPELFFEIMETERFLYKKGSIN